jgi:5-methylthioadenosine/S-adenosylhomocysteine deaminase
MGKKAVYAGYVYYDGRIETDKYLVFNDNIIEGISSERPDCEVTERPNSCVFPGLINTHTHLPMSFFRGIADDLKLMDWLQNHIWPAETKWLNDEFVYDATLLSGVEMIRCGTVCANDMYFFSDHVAAALLKTGLRGVVGVGVLDFPTKTGKGADDYIAKGAELYLKYKDHDTIDISLCPHAPFTVNPDNYRKCVEFCGKHGILLHTHLLEAEDEKANIVARYGKTPVEIMDEAGAFDIKSIFAHSIHLDDAEIEFIGSKGVATSHCLESNLKLASGFSPVKKMMDAGVNVTIGTDGAASNNDIDMIGEMSCVAKFHKAFSKDATALSAETVLKMATEDAAKALGLEKCGVLKAGYKADFFVLSFDSVSMTPVYNPVSHLIYSASANDVTDVYVNGKCLMDNNIITIIDEDEIKIRARRWASKINGN